MDHPVFYGEPHMHTLIASFDDGGRLLLKSLRIGKARAFHCFRPILVLGIQGQNVLTNGRIRLILNKALFYPGGKSTLVLQPLTGLNENTLHSPNPRVPLRSPASNETHRRDEG
jgi:hypothetical protein